MVRGVPQLDRHRSSVGAELLNAHRYAAVIGIDNYSNGVMPLQTAGNDARALAQCLEQDHGYEVDLRLNEQAKLNDLLDLIEEGLFDRVTEHTTFLLYFAGHAFADGDALDPEGFFFPQDSKKGEEDTWLPMKTVSSALEELPCKHLLLILDCCFAGSFRWATSRAIVPLGKPLYDQQLQRFLKGEAWHLLTSSAYNETAVDLLSSPQSPDLDPQAETTRHSPFAAALLAGLRGEADTEQGGFQSDGIITVTELYQYVCNRFESSRETRLQTPGLSNLKRTNRGQFVFLAPGKEKNTLPSPKLNEHDNPWLGLSAYTRNDSERFFGRKAVVEDLFQRVTDQPVTTDQRIIDQKVSGEQARNDAKYKRWTVVIGASGSGKSSIVRAGLIPKLLRQEPEPWHVVVMPRLRAANPTLLLKNVEDELAAVSGPKLLVIDQFEEVFSQNTLGLAGRGPFFERLMRLVDDSEHLRLVLTVRSDFEPQMRSITAFGRGIAQAFFPVPQPNALELRQIVEGPAALQDLYFEPPELVTKITQDVLAMPGALPMISFALAEMYRTAWQRRFAEGHSRAITQEDFDDVGGVVGSLHNRANGLWDAAPATKRDMIRWVFLRMVSDEGGRLSRRRVVREELQRPTLDENRLVEEVLVEYSQAHLLIRDDGYYEPGHDALVVAWPRLLRWLEASDTQPLLRALWDSATAWREEKKRRAKLGHLWTENPRLSLVKNLSSRLKRLRQRIYHPGSKQQVREAEKQRKARLRELNALELRFVEASVHEVRKRAVKTLVYRGIIYASFLAFGLYAWHQSNEFQRVAQVAKSRLQIASAGSLLDQGETDLAALVALELENPQRDTSAARILHQTLFEHLPEQSRFASLDATDDPVSQAFWSPSGSTVLVAGRSGQMHIWFPHESERDLLRVAPGRAGQTSVDALRAVAWSPDSRRIAVVDRQAELRIFKLQVSTGRSRWLTESTVTLPRAAEGLCEPNDFTALEWHPEAARLFVVYRGEAPVIWDADLMSPEPQSLGDGSSGAVSMPSIPALSDPVLSTLWDHEGKRLLIVTQRSALRWHVDKATAEATKIHHEPLLTGRWDPTGRHAVLATTRSVHLWDADEDRITELFSKAPPAESSPKPLDELLPSAEPAEPGEPRREFEQTLPDPAAETTLAAWSSDGTQLLLVWRGEGLLWRSNRYHELQRFELGGRTISGLAWSPRGDQLLESSATSVSLWDMEAHAGLARLETVEPVTEAAWSPDGTRVLTATAGSLDIWPVAPRMVQALLMQELQTCLIPQEREQYLQELSEEAVAKAEACERCTPKFFDSLNSQLDRRSSLNRLDLAWDAYRLCLEEPVVTPWARNGAEQVPAADAGAGLVKDPICRTRFQDDVIPGQWRLYENQPVCLFAPPPVSYRSRLFSPKGPQLTQRDFEVLSGHYQWSPDLQHLEKAVIGGRQGPQALYICRGRLEGEVRIGKWIDDRCWIGEIPSSGSSPTPVEIQEDLEILTTTDTGWLSWISQFLASE